MSQGKRFIHNFAVAASLLTLAACNESMPETQVTAKPAPATAAPGSSVHIYPNYPSAPQATPFTMSGTPSNTARQDVYYWFTPGWSGGSGHPSFSITNKPAWATFSASDGTLAGVPPEAGQWTNIVISGVDGSTQVNTSAFTITASSDPLKKFQWHLTNTAQKNFAQNAGIAGMDLGLANAVKNGIWGTGVKIAISDSGCEIAHEDLADNVITGASRDYAVNNTHNTAPYAGDPSPLDTTDGDHGTSVAGIIAAVGWNGIGGRGVASNAKFAVFNYISSDQATSKLVDQADGNFDVFNQSWGVDPEGDELIENSYLDQLVYGTQSLRGGRGAVYVKAAGNSFQPYSNATYITADANGDPYNTVPYVIVVGALNAKGVRSSYSSIGSSLWISGFGGEYGKTNPAILTTDQSGCTNGYSRNPLTDALNLFEPGNADNSNCNYTSTFNGTSSATPTITGVVALLLQANPSLGWRDIKHLLAASAVQTEPSFAPIQNRASDSTGLVWESGWTTNAAGYKFHNYYGFGRVNVDAAIELAKNYTPIQSAFVSSWIDSGTLSKTIPDDTAAGVADIRPFASALTIEAVQIEVSATHPYTGDLAIELTSPSGTKSILLHANNSFTSDTNLVKMKLLSNAFYGENAWGNWMIRVIDASPGETGTRKLTNWKLKVYGH